MNSAWLRPTQCSTTEWNDIHHDLSHRQSRRGSWAIGSLMLFDANNQRGSRVVKAEVSERFEESSDTTCDCNFAWSADVTLCSSWTVLEPCPQRLAYFWNYKTLACSANHKLQFSCSYCFTRHEQPIGLFYIRGFQFEGNLRLSDGQSETCSISISVSKKRNNLADTQGLHHNLWRLSLITMVKPYFPCGVSPSQPHETAPLP